MKLTILLVFIIAISLGGGLPWAEDMQGMDSKGPAMQDMRASSSPAPTHHAAGTVKRLDAAKGSVTISHGAVKTLNWPAMTMTFSVKDKALLSLLAEGKKVRVDFVQEGSDYTIVKVQ